ncbi:MULTISPECIES: ECF transporter S component [unclassified Sporolactobacillus]|uniref:ECF transporter S component n=1 Tax=unclassified Sporolactobacillus TaxID=2628533 RepID=UPI0023680F18|nr:ECF transporter S component [Sporolactobacillus sp. CQH2019]MDD9148742.1 ECF transporter S component [Sporolactobacillus sp. CQH2019]
MSKSKSRKLNLTDILVTIVVSLVFGLVFRLLGPVYDMLQSLGLQLDALIYGIWFIAGPFAALLIRKPGVAFLAETAAAIAEMLFAGSGGIINVYYGVVQGIFSELIFAAWRYRKFTVSVAVLSGIAASIGSFLIDLVYGYLTDLAGWNLTLNIGFRIIGAALLAGVFPYILVKALEKTGVTNLIRPVSKEDYDALK